MSSVGEKGTSFPLPMKEAETDRQTWVFGRLSLAGSALSNPPNDWLPPFFLLPFPQVLQLAAVLRMMSGFGFTRGRVRASASGPDISVVLMALCYTAPGTCFSKNSLLLILTCLPLKARWRMAGCASVEIGAQQAVVSGGKP